MSKNGSIPTERSAGMAVGEAGGPMITPLVVGNSQDSLSLLVIWRISQI